MSHRFYIVKLFMWQHFPPHLFQHHIIFNCDSLTVATDGFQCFYLQKSD